MPDFATTLTSAGADDTDQFVETLCDHSTTRYIYKGTCRKMQPFNAGTIGGKPVKFMTTVNGPVVGYAKVGRHKVAIASKRASYGKDVLDLLFNRRLSDGQVNSPQSFIKAAALTPQTFNSFYVDDKHVAEITTGLLPIRAKGTDPSLPTVGNGKYEWTGDLSVKGHPQGIDPAHTPTKGTMVNWNNDSAHGFGSADDAWGANGSVARVSLLNRALAQHRKHGKWTLAAVTSAMNEAATQNVLAIETVPLLARVLKGSHAPSAAGRQDAVASGRLEQGRRQRAGSQQRRQGRQPGRRDHRHRLAQDRQRVHEAGDRPAARPSLTRCSASSMRPPAASTTAGISTSTATSNGC